MKGTVDANVKKAIAPTPPIILVKVYILSAIRKVATGYPMPSESESQNLHLLQRLLSLKIIIKIRIGMSKQLSFVVTAEDKASQSSATFAELNPSSRSRKRR
ncbi:MAG: hypothetical protein DRN03_05185 [Thermoplasmata archaeon]|nr:MAG: hypothetical protein DRN03_05185 [Thermoplasmata archaeon]